MAGIGIGAIQRQGQPDAAESGQVNRGEDFAVDDYPQQELQGGRHELDQADRGQAQPAARLQKQQQRHDGDQAGGQQQEIGLTVQRAERAGAARREREQEQRGDGRHQPGFHAQTQHRGTTVLLAQQPVTPKA